MLVLTRYSFDELFYPLTRDEHGSGVRTNSAGSGLYQT